MSYPEQKYSSSLYNELFTTFITLQAEIECRRKRIKKNADLLLLCPKRRRPVDV